MLAEQNGLWVEDRISEDYEITGIFLPGTERQQNQRGLMSWQRRWRKDAVGGHMYDYIFDRNCHVPIFEKAAKRDFIRNGGIKDGSLFGRYVTKRHRQSGLQVRLLIFERMNNFKV